MDAPPGEAKRRRPHSFRSLRRAPLSDRGASFCEVCIKSTECAGLALTPGLPSSNKPAASPRKLGEAPRMQTLGIRGSSNGRTADSGSAYRGSNPCPRTRSFRPHRLAVRTSASHAGNTSSSLVGVTRKGASLQSGAPLFFRASSPRKKNQQIPQSVTFPAPWQALAKRLPSSNRAASPAAVVLRP